ncbi:hypothetical protein [Halarchaeum acidiphilum]|uniref:hypothetical protein n=1 Tax=Halarchaeum acidiphilum TaxID=489138 RepID=UPI00036FA4C0|nr:hypothetical protein [Halarchaeum acidiphilum]
MSEETPDIDPMRLDLGAFVGLLAVLPLVSIGTVSDIAPLWWIGLGLLCVSSVMALATKFIFDEIR